MKRNERSILQLNYMKNEDIVLEFKIFKRTTRGKITKEEISLGRKKKLGE